MQRKVDHSFARYNTNFYIDLSYQPSIACSDYKQRERERETALEMAWLWPLGSRLKENTEDGQVIYKDSDQNTLTPFKFLVFSGPP